MRWPVELPPADFRLALVDLDDGRVEHQLQVDRHTDRVTRLSCSECGRSICAECSQDAAVGQKCPVCSGPPLG